jgi:hypothetical protein
MQWPFRIAAHLGPVTVDAIQEAAEDQAEAAVLATAANLVAITISVSSAGLPLAWYASYSSPISTTCAGLSIYLFI